MGRGRHFRIGRGLSGTAGISAPGLWVLSGSFCFRLSDVHCGTQGYPSGCGKKENPRAAGYGRAVKIQEAENEGTVWRDGKACRDCTGHAERPQNPDTG